MQNLSVHGFHIYNMMDFIFKVNLTLKFNVNKKTVQKECKEHLFTLSKNIFNHSLENSH